MLYYHDADAESSLYKTFNLAQEPEEQNSSLMKEDSNHTDDHSDGVSWIVSDL